MELRGARAVKVAESGVMGAEGTLWMDTEGALSSGIEGMLPSGTEDLIMRRVVQNAEGRGGSLIGAEAWGSLVIGRGEEPIVTVSAANRT